MEQAYPVAEQFGFEPKLRDYLNVIESALSGDIVLVVSPATLGSSAATVAADIAGSGFSRTVTVELQDSNGYRHVWANLDLDIAVADVTAGDGTSAIHGGGSTVSLEAGFGVVTIDYSGTWAAADTETLTVTGGTILGYTVSNKTSVDTLVA